MGKERRRTRVKSKIDELPEEIKELLNKRLGDVTVTYEEIAEELNELGYRVGKSSIGRYALRQNDVAKRLREAQEQTVALINAVKANPDIDYTEAGLQILTNGLVKKFATAQEEFEDMPLDKAGRIMVQISRTKAYKDKVRETLNKGYKKAIEEVKDELRQELKNTPELLAQIMELTDRVDTKMEQKLEGVYDG